MSIVDGNVDDGNGLICECAGIITQVGPGSSFQVGDRVVVIGDGSCSTVLKTTSALCAKIPDNLSFEDAATMLCVYTTVNHSLLDLARIEKDQVRKHTRKDLIVLLLTNSTDCSDSIYLRRYRHCSLSHLSYSWCKSQNPRQCRAAQLADQNRYSLPLVPKRRLSI